MSKYEGACGTPNWHGYTMRGDNFRELRKHLREVCKGNLFVGQIGWVEIWDAKKGPSYNPHNSIYYSKIK